MVDDVQHDPTVAEPGFAPAASSLATDDFAPPSVPEDLAAPADFPGVTSTSAKLVVKRGGVETDIEFPIQGSAILGRFDPSVGPIDVDLGGIPEGSYVSRKHAKITLEDGVWKIADLGSSNGTYVLNSDFDKVTESEIHDGQEIALGNARLVFHLVTA